MSDVRILGIGMHPWGKWGRNFVEYGAVAARAALADAGLAMADVDYLAAGNTMRNGYPGYVAGSSFAQALGWSGLPVSSSYAACASGAVLHEVAPPLAPGVHPDAEDPHVAHRLPSGRHFHTVCSASSSSYRVSTTRVIGWPRASAPTSVPRASWPSTTSCSSGSSTAATP